MIHRDETHLAIDGTVVCTADDAPLGWGPAVWGHVLEVGLGMGLLAEKISENRRVTRHIIVEESLELINMSREYVPRTATVLHATFPIGISLTWFGTFDCVCLDIPDSYEQAAVGVKYLADGGALFVRRTA